MGVRHGTGAQGAKCETEAGGAIGLALELQLNYETVLF